MLYYNWKAICEIRDDGILRAIFADSSQLGLAQVRATLPDLVGETAQFPHEYEHLWKSRQEEVVAVLKRTHPEESVLAICARMNCPYMKLAHNIRHSQSPEDLFGQVVFSGWVAVGSYALDEEEAERWQNDDTYYWSGLILIPKAVFE